MKNRVKGFTLIELIAVIVILGIILVIVVPTALDAFYKARKTLSKMEEKVLLDAGEIYITDLDKGKKKYICNETTCKGAKKTYNKGEEMSGYDLKVYVIDHSGINVDVRTLVEGGYYDEMCRYDVEGYEGKPSPSCRIQEECVLKVEIEWEKSPDGLYYVTKGYKASVDSGCKK